jgi:energy-coupling factor transport system ATP-binding protein
VGVVGPTAAGKSSLLQVLAGLLAPTSGSAAILGRQRALPGEVAMVFQRPEIQLFAATVREDVAMAPRLAGVAGDALDERVDWALRLVGLDPADFGPRSPHTLSVGEQRRAAVAGVISLGPRILILDEPGAGLDPRGRRALLGRLLAWAREGRSDAGPARTLVFTSHDLDEVAEAADSVLVLDGGRLRASGGPELLADPALLESAGLRPPLVARLARALGLSVERPPVRAASLVELLRERSA